MHQKTSPWVTVCLALLVLSLMFTAAPVLAETPTPEAAATGEAAVEAPLATPDPSKPPLVLGAVFNATGWMATYDQMPRSAALLAIDDINSRGGVMGRELKLIELDGKTDPATVGKRYIRLTEAEWAFRTASGDIVLPAESAGGIRTTVRSRHVTEPEAEQEALLRRLGLTLPRRLKRLDGHAPVE